MEQQKLDLETTTEQEKSYGNAQEQENSSKSGKIIQVVNLQGTPFQVINVKDQGWVGIIGQATLTGGPYKTPEEAKEDLDKKLAQVDWGIISTVINELSKINIQYILSKMAREEK